MTRMKRSEPILTLLILMLLLLSGCMARKNGNEPKTQVREDTALATPSTSSAPMVTETATGFIEQTAYPTQEEETAKMLIMRINDIETAVEWENNPSVEALMELCADKSLVIEMSMYGGFEQVGSLGARLPANDVQTKTAAGDIVLYSSNQIVVFYGTNSWAYTRLVHMTGLNETELKEMLGKGNVTITLSMEDAE